MRVIDFMIQDVEPDKLGEKILENVICHRLDNHKPAVIFLAGGSGEGKSYTGLRLLEIINNYYGAETDVENQIVYTPLEYAAKIKKLLFDKNFKKHRVLMLDEAREIVNAKDWQSFLNYAISDVNVLMRRVKPMAIIIISQYWKDIDTKIRRTVNYYGKVFRPIGGNRRARLKLFRIWEDDYDLERPVIRKRPLAGYVKMNNKYVYVRPKFFEIRMPDKKIRDIYDDLNYVKKSMILQRKLKTLMDRLEKELGVKQQDRIKLMVDWFLEHPEQLSLVLEKKRGKLKVKKNVKEMYDLTDGEVKEFANLLISKLAEKGVMTSEAMQYV